MINKQLFFEGYKSKLDKNLTKKEVEDIDLFIDMVNNELDQFTLFEWAYVFATVYHETAHTFHPVIEAYWKTEEWRKRNFRYYPFFGRGYVQITWESNYKVFSKILKIDLVKNPELTLEPKNAFFILVYGLKNGSFTGKSLPEYNTSSYTDRMKFVNMRRVINGTDKAELIADYAQEFLRILKLATQ